MNHIRSPKGSPNIKFKKVQNYDYMYKSYKNPYKQKVESCIPSL